MSKEDLEGIAQAEDRNRVVALVKRLREAWGLPPMEVRWKKSEFPTAVMGGMLIIV